MAYLRQPGPEELLRGILGPWLIPWMKSLGSIFLAAAMRGHSWCRNARQTWWQCWSYQHGLLGQFCLERSYMGCGLYYSTMNRGYLGQISSEDLSENRFLVVFAGGIMWGELSPPCLGKGTLWDINFRRDFVRAVALDLETGRRGWNKRAFESRIFYHRISINTL